MTAVQRDEAAHETFTPELGQIAFGRIEGMGIDTARTQGAQHAVAREQGNLTLGRAATKEHGDFAENMRIDRHSARPSRV